MFTFMLSAVKSNSGKTVISSGITRALVNRGLTVAPFKCGPDYIDAIWLSRAAGKSAYNLDTVLITGESVKSTFLKGLHKCDGGVIEGVMGLFDGLNPATFEGSSYHVAKLLNLPVILIIDAAGMAASASAIVSGVSKLAEGVRMAGIILNKVSGAKQEQILKIAINTHNPEVPVLGAIPATETLSAGSKHLGLSIANRLDHEHFFEKAAETAEKYIDLDKLVSITSYNMPHFTEAPCAKATKTAAVAYDDAFNFYYQSTFDLLEQNGFEIHKFSPLADETFGQADLLLLGGGYPELFAEKLSGATRTQEAILRHHKEKLPIFAECGGFLYLAKNFSINGKSYPFTGIFDIDAEMTDKRQNLGYVYHKTAGMRGHTFHYSRLTKINESYWGTAEKLSDQSSYSDGFLKDNCFGSYTHFMPDAAGSFFKDLINRGK